MSSSGFLYSQPLYLRRTPAQFCEVARRRPPSLRPRCCARQEPPEIPGGRKFESSGLDGEVRDLLDAGVRDALRGASDEELREADRRVLDGIAEVGAGDLREIGDAVSGDLGAAGKEIADRADALLEGELEETLKRFDGRKEELMKEVFAQRDVIREEAELIKTLAQSLEDQKAGSGNPEDRKQSALFAVAGLLFLGGLYYAWQGIVESSDSALQNAVVDIAASAFAAFLYQRGQRKIEEDDGSTT